MHRLAPKAHFALLAAALLATHCGKDSRSIGAVEADRGQGKDLVALHDATAGLGQDSIAPIHDGRGPRADQAASGYGKICIEVQGDTTPSVVNDGLAGQTPKQYTMGLGRFEILNPAADELPQVIFDFGSAPRDVRMDQLNAIGCVPTSTLPPGTYTHGRVQLTNSKFTVDAVLHLNLGIKVNTPISVVAALSDTTIDGKPYLQNLAQATLPNVPLPVQFALPDLPSTGGGVITQTGGKTWMTFSFGNPLVIPAPVEPVVYTGTIIYNVGSSFRWQDQPGPEYQSEQFDMSVGAVVQFEPVERFGATGYGFKSRTVNAPTAALPDAH